MLPTVSELRADSAIMVMCAMPDPGSPQTACAIAECHRLFERCRSPYEALLIPALAIWSAMTGGDVRCREHLPRFGRVGGFLIERRLVIECDGATRSVARDRDLRAAGYAVRRLAMEEMREGDLRRELHAMFDSVRVVH